MPTLQMYLTEIYIFQMRVMVDTEAVKVVEGKSRDMVTHKTEQLSRQSRGCSAFSNST